MILALSTLMNDFTDNMSLHTLFHDESISTKTTEEIKEVCVPQIYTTPFI